MFYYILKIIKIIDKKYFSNFFFNFKKIFLYLKSKLLLNKIDYKFNIFYSKTQTVLSSLCDEHQCDKGYFDLSDRVFYKNLHPHTYADFYSLLFEHCRNDVKKVFECGIGTNNPTLASTMGIKYKPGASLRVWKNYFINASIYGGDIDKNILFEENRIKTFYVDQLNELSILKMWQNINTNEFDLIIDDGLHEYDAAVTLFKNSYHKLKRGGLYIIEDVCPSYLLRLTNFFIKDYNTRVVILTSSKKKLLLDNNVILITKN